ncbi:MAG: MFS transporter [Nitrososphaeria archaeon]
MEEARRTAQLFIMSFFAQLPLSMVRFVVPIYAQRLGASDLILGLIGFSYGLAYVFAAAYFGKLSERMGYSRSIAVGMFLYGAVVSLYIFMNLPSAFIAIRAAEALSMALVWPSIEALLRFFKDTRSSTAVYTIGWAIASSIASVAASYLMLYISVPFMASVAFSFFAALSAMQFEAKEKAGKSIRISAGKEIALPIFVYGFSASIIYAFYPAYAASIFSLKWAGAILSVSSFFVILAFFISPLLRHEPKISITAGISLQLFYFLIFLSRSPFVHIMALSFIFFGIGLIYYFVLYRITLTEIEGLGFRTGIFESSIGAGYTVAPLLGGLFSILGARYIWLFAFATALSILALWSALEGFLLLKNGASGP